MKKYHPEKMHWWGLPTPAVGEPVIFGGHAGAASRIYIGTYTKKSSQGVYVYRWKPESGEMEEIGLAAKTQNPSFLTLSPNRNDLYCVNEQDHATGNVSAFAIDHTTGKLIAKNVVPSGGSALVT